MAGEESLFDIPPPLDDFDIDSSKSPVTGVGQLGNTPLSSFSPPPLSELPPLDSFDDFPVIDTVNQINGLNSVVTNDKVDDDFGDFASSKDGIKGVGGEKGNVRGLNDTTGPGNNQENNTQSGNTEFGGFAAFGETKDDSFGEFSTAANDTGFTDFTSFASFDQNNGSGQPSTTESKDEGFGNFTGGVSEDDITDPIKPNDNPLANQFQASLQSPPPIDDDFGEFGDFSSETQPAKITPINAPVATPPIDDDFGEFGDFSSETQPAKTTPINAPVDTPPIDDDFGEFGDFSSETQPAKTTPINAPVATPPPLDEGDDDFGDFGDFSSQTKPAITTPTKAPVATPPPGKIKVCVDVLVACFPLKSVPKSTASIKKLSSDFCNESCISELSKETTSTGALYQWSQSLLQDRFFSALKVDPMLVPSGGSSGKVDTDPFALTNLLGDLGSGLETKPSGFGWSNKENDGGATLLDLSLPMSPKDKDAKDSEGVQLDEDLKELDLNTSLSKQSVGMAKQEGHSSWMDSELLELEKELPVSGSSQENGGIQSSSSAVSSNLDWLNNPNLTTMVKPAGDGDGMGISLFPSLEPTSSSIAELELLPSVASNPVPAPPTTSSAPPTASPDPPTSIKTSSDSLQIDIDNFTTSSSPDPLNFGLIPPDPILTGSASTDVIFPYPGSTTNVITPDPIFSGPSSISKSPEPILSANTATTIEQQKMEVASNALDMVMEMTNMVTTTTSPTHSSTGSTGSSGRLSLIPPKSSIDIIEDQLLEMTLSKDNGKTDTTKKSELSREAWSLLNSLPDLSFMRKQ